MTEPASEPLDVEGGPARGGSGPTEPSPTAAEQTAVVPVSEQSEQGPEEPKIMPGVTVQAEPTKSKLPKRVPSKPPSRTPFGVQTTSPATPQPQIGQATDVTDAPRSLFEPIVPAADEGTSTPPPPHRLRQGSGGGRGPFGPGSAMPLPGGASPSPEFTIKASVAALRYCTPDSPQFGRTVAEVWFRTAADAERVGFRPVG